ncbi:unnamed protein product [Brassica oleracea var. botrytis]
MAQSVSQPSKGLGQPSSGTQWIALSLLLDDDDKKGGSWLPASTFSPEGIKPRGVSEC